MEGLISGMTIGLGVIQCDIHDVNITIGDVWNQNKWNLERLWTYLPEEETTIILKESPRLCEGVPDIFV
ncbi:putative ribonuclease H protein [Sesbania bispinosa]|nr:putative ribonuclease H protein [Sesbania bispinosa]